ncbi:MAG: hypothetical protein AB1918_08655 [Pseudomonadota bacterium]
MKKTALLSAASAIAMAASLAAAPAHAYDTVYWDWTHIGYTDVYALFDIDVDFVAWGLTQVERLQVMAGDMTAFADGSHASYNGVTGGYVAPGAPVHVDQTAVAVVVQDQDVRQSNTNTQKGAALAGLSIGKTEAEVEQEQMVDQTNRSAQNAAAIAANVIYVDMGDIEPYWVDGIDARKHLAKVEIGATAISNVASTGGEHVVMAHDGQIAFGGFSPVDTAYDTPVLNGDALDTEAAVLANLALANWLDHDGYVFIGSGNRNYDMLMLGWTAAQYGLIDKGYNSAYAFGDYITDAQLDVSATAAANIHTVDVGTRLEAGPDEDYDNGAIATDNVAMVDLNQFGYQDTYAHASAVGHSISGYSHLGKLEAPALKVTASALGNVSTVTNKFNGSE